MRRGADDTGGLSSSSAFGLPVRYEEIEHTADVGIRAYGSTLDDLFANAAEGMFSLVADLGSVKAVGEIEVRLEAEDLPTLLLRWLSELLYIHETQRLLFASFEVHVDGTSLRGCARGDPIRGRASIREPFRMASENDFPSNIGLGASASGFAALATAAIHAAGLHLTDEEISRFARRGAGSATRSVTGGFSKWKMGLTDEDSYAVQLAGVDLRMSMIVALVPAFTQPDDAPREALTSPFFHARLAEMPRLIAEMELAIRRRAIGEICALAERDTLMLHGITMTGN